MSGQQGAPQRSLAIPQRALVLLIGISGSGKTTFSRKHFTTYQVVSSDHCRGLICDDEADQEATSTAFDLLHYIVDKRLAYGKFTVVDATNVTAHARRSLLTLAREYNFASVAIVLDVGEEVALTQNAQRPGRQVIPAAISSQEKDLQSSRKTLPKEGFSRIYVLRGAEEVTAVKLAIGR